MIGRLMRAIQPIRSVRRKLLVVAMITTAVALLLASTMFLTRDLSAYRQLLTSDLQTEGSILALSTSAALAFDDRATAERNVTALSARAAIVSAAIYAADGRLYASYSRPGAASPPQRLPQLVRGLQIADGYVELTHRIVQDNEPLGTIYLRARYNAAERVRAYLGIVALVGLLTLGVALVLSAILQRTITEPMRSMARIAQRVIAERDYSLRALGASRDEIGLVVEAFNSMLDEVQSRTRALIQSNTALKSEVEHREAAEAALKEADRRKDEFLATLAHELRNPLAPISQAARLLELPATDEAQREWSRKVIGRQVQRMALLLDDLLDVSRITRGQLHLRTTHVELSTIVRSALEVARPLIESKGHSLKVELPQHAIELQADPLRLSQALSNLIANAAKYTDQGGHISLKVDLSEHELCFVVRDDGIGISAAAIPALFEMFSQVHSAIDRSEGGLGIGLALVKGLVTLHGGRVEAASEGPGCGSTFTIHLPRTIIVPHREIETHGSPLQGSSGAPRCSVLVADDNRDAADSLAMLLSASGYPTSVAHSGREALDLAMREHPDALILDIGMPDMTGYEVASHVRAQQWGHRAMLVAATGWGQQQDKVRATAAGFDYHFTKPVTTQAIEAILAQFSQQIQRDTHACQTEPTSSYPIA